MRKWVDEMLNDEIRSFLDIFISEKIFLASPEARADALVHKEHDFTNPPPNQLLTWQTFWH